MKPFRGKPEKPERSKGEIHSRFAVGVRRSCDGMRSRVPHLSFFDPIANACTFLLVGRRDPLGVGLRLAVEPKCSACRYVWTRVSRLTRSTVYERFKAALGAFDSLQARQMCRRSDLVPVLTSDDCWQRRSRTDFKPISDAIALGTFRTRLETRTKESSMCASHWESLNLKAQ